MARHRWSTIILIWNRHITQKQLVDAPIDHLMKWCDWCKYPPVRPRLGYNTCTCTEAVSCLDNHLVAVRYAIWDSLMLSWAQQSERVKSGMYKLSSKLGNVDTECSYLYTNESGSQFGSLWYACVSWAKRARWTWVESHTMWRFLGNEISEAPG